MKSTVKEFEEEERFKNYPKTEFFSVIKSLAFPHPYCITDKHVSYAAKYWGGMLNENVIENAERSFEASCGTCKLNLSEHEMVLVVNCKGGNKEKLLEYLLLIKPLALKEGFEGFVFERDF